MDEDFEDLLSGVVGAVEATSTIVDHDMVQDWLKDNLPKTAFRDDGYLNKTNAMNFHNVFPRKVLDLISNSGNLLL